MLRLAASRRLLYFRPDMDLYLRARAHSQLSSWSKGVTRFRHEPPRRKLSCRQGAFEERDTAMDKAMSSTDYLLGHCKDENAAHPMENNFANEFMQLSLEEGSDELCGISESVVRDEQLGYCKDENAAYPMESNFANEFMQLSVEDESDELCGISESVMRDVQKSAFELLAARGFTVSELTKKLRSKKYPVDVIDTVVAEFKTRGLLNDGFYAESFSRSRWVSSTWGPRRIKQALRQKGVPEAEVDQATRTVFQDGQQTRYGISEASMDHLFAQASKQWMRGQSLTLENRRARIVRWLQYRGFDWAVTNAIIRKLEGKHPP